MARDLEGMVAKFRSSWSEQETITMSATTTSTSAMTTSELERQVVVFSLHGEHYGLPITSVREIIRYTPPASDRSRERSDPGHDLPGRPRSPGHGPLKPDGRQH